MNLISSKDNPLFKKIIKLEKSKERKESGLFTIEGKKETLLALQNGYVITDLILAENSDLSQTEKDLFLKIPNHHRFSINLFSKITYRNDHSECIAICKVPKTDLNKIKLSKNPLLIILESVEKPGNLGAILRSADACAADAVIICEEKSDFFNPNVIRSSVGTVFSVNKASAKKEEVVRWLKKNQINTYTTFIENALPYSQANFKQGCAIVLGTEAVGLSNYWRQKEFQNIVIPMRGQNDSLNVSVAAAILMFEARNQKD
ncbi:MAG: RNA methyltransferase [Bacteroidetes bacterium]|nr:RNA methyltransferase [Bacteroidota bacterium]